MKRLSSWVALWLGLAPLLAIAEAPQDRFGAGGYFRVMARPDLEGGTSKLGFWNLYGRLLNEGPWAVLELKLDVLQAPAGTHEIWASVHAKLEGNSILGVDPDGGNLKNFHLSQLYVEAGNILFDRVTWRLGTLYTYFGDLGLYDARPAQLFFNTVGLAAQYRLDRFELFVGLGDSGYGLKGAQYSAVPTAGAFARLRLGEHLELGVGGEYAYEPSVSGDRFAPHYTPGMRYEDYVRGEVVQRFLQDNPGMQDLFPRPLATSARSYSVMGTLGFGKLGPIRWDNLFVSWRRLHPATSTVESFQGRDFTLYLAQLTGQRYQLVAGNEMQFSVVPGRLDAAWAVLYGLDRNEANEVAAGDDNRIYLSTVLRLQLYLTRTVHLLTESSLAQERSLEGNLYRQHADSVFQSSRGVPDTRGLEIGDSATRNTWQLKTGLVLNPTGMGIFARPSLRLLYGLQYSSQQAAYGNGFVASLDQYNVFQSPERHWHSVIAIEAEAWF